MELVYTTSKKISAIQIEKAGSTLGLQLTMKGKLKSLPDNVHWHYKMPKQPGVLEITLMLNEDRLIFTCKKNRTGEWIAGSIEELKQLLKVLQIA